MKTVFHSVSFAALLLPSTLIADSVHVTFNAALTNETEWTYASGFEYTDAHKKYGFKSANNGKDQISSPLFDFAITSVVIHAEKTSSSTTRRMSIRASSGNSSQEPVELVKDIVPAEQVAFTSEYSWAESDHVRSFSLLSTGGSGNLYLADATIFGAPLITSPLEVIATSTNATNVTLEWHNDARSLSNRLVVATHSFSPEAGTIEREYNFDEFSNGGGNPEKTAEILAAYPDLDGYMLCLPTNSTGQIQISNRDIKGVLSITGFESCEDLHLMMTARHYNHDDEVKSVSIGYVNGDTTNDFATVDLSEHFSRSVTALESVPPNARIVLNNLGNKKFHRVIIDDIKFIRGYSPAHVVTNTVLSSFVVGSTTAKVSGLKPKTQYFISVTSFGEDEIESAPSEAVEVWTNDRELPFTIRIF